MSTDETGEEFPVTILLPRLEDAVEGRKVFIQREYDKKCQALKWNLVSNPNIQTSIIITYSLHSDELTSTT